MSVVLMRKRELNRIDVLARLESGRLTPGAAAALLRVSERQVYRLMRRFREGGPAAIADRRRGRPSNNRLPDVLRNQAVALVREHYADFGPTLAAEKLADRHDVRVSRETLRSWMIQAGVWRPRAERKRFHQPRHRREHVGELIQIDGCEHHWFEDRGPPCTLLVFVDDATSRLMALAGMPPEWVNVLRDLDRLQEATVESGGKTWTVRTEATGAIPALMKVAGITLPPASEQPRRLCRRLRRHRPRRSAGDGPGVVPRAPEFPENTRPPRYLAKTGV